MSSKSKETFTLFYHTESPFSQWHPAEFTIDGNHFHSAEQYMMYGKAMLFEDEQTAQRILRAKHPREQKQLGREVQHFNKKHWQQHARDIVYKGNEAKFTQNPHLLSALLSTAGTTLVEASPSDTIWGVGLEADNPLILNRNTWKGTNWLGEVLTSLRDTLLKEQQ